MQPHAAHEGPQIAPDINHVPAYVAAPIAAAMPIRAYVGVPLYGADGSLFGTLCAIDPLPSAAELESFQPTIELHARLLASILAHEIRVDYECRRAEALEHATSWTL